jgi:hypothetical protein
MERSENNEEKILREINDREKTNTEIWKEVNKMKTMVTSGMATVIGAMLLFIGSIIAHLLKVGP